MDTQEPLLGAAFTGALAYAAQTHRSQERKGTSIPYVAHLLAVCGLVLEGGGTEDEAIAALLHDAPEDQGGEPTLKEIQALFGDAVANIVEACSDTFEDPKPPWEARKRAYLEHLASAPKSVLLVSIADKLHNATSTLRDMRAGSDVWSRFSASREQTLWYYRALIGIYESAAPDPRRDPLLDELRRTAAALSEEASG